MTAVEPTSLPLTYSSSVAPSAASSKVGDGFGSYLLVLEYIELYWSYLLLAFESYASLPAIQPRRITSTT